MNESFTALLSSRKFFVGALSLLAVFASVFLVALKLIPESSLIPTISAITTTGLGCIGAIAWEDVTDKKASAPLPPQPPSPVTNNVTTFSQPTTTTTQHQQTPQQTP